MANPIRSRATVTAVLAGAIILLPAAAHANAGTPLMWLGMAHLTFGNLFIGVAEGLILGRIFRVNFGRATGLMVAANYCSMLAGVLTVQLLAAAEPNLDIYNALLLLGTVLGLLFVATALVEWPFCHAVVNGSPKYKPVTRRVSLVAAVIAQVCSYSVLVPLYLTASSLSLVTATNTTRDLGFASASKAVVYYVSSNDGDVYSIRPDGTQRRLVRRVGIDNENSRLYLRRSNDTWDIYASEHPDVESTAKLISGLGGSAARSWQDEHDSGPEGVGTWSNFGESVDLRPGTRESWAVWTGFWPIEGMWAQNKVTERTFSVAFETPFASWPLRNVHVLPGNLVVFQAGEQVLVLHLDTRKLALLARGRGPLVIIPR